MKLPAPFALLSVLCLCGCAHMDLTPEGNPERTAVGRVEVEGVELLPPGAVLVVRVLDTIISTEPPPTAVLGSASASAPLHLPPKVLGEQTIKAPDQIPIPFSVAYTADDSQLRTGLKIEARISYDGQVRYYNVNSYAITLNNVNDPHIVTVVRADR